MKVVIVGGVAGGASVAARLRRKNEKAEIIMFERGEHISYASCGLPYYLSDTINERDKLLVMTPEKFKTLLNVDVRVNSNVISIDRKKKTVKIEDVKTGKSYEENYDKLVLSPGAKPFIPPMDGVDSDRIFTLRNVSDADKIKEKIKKENAKNIIVIGGGFIGVEVAENLKEAGIETSIIEMGNQLLPQLDFEFAVKIHNHLLEKGVGLYLENSVTGFTETKNGIVAKLKSGEEITTDYVILSIGVRPENELAVSADLEIGKRGHIIVDKNLLTNDKNIYAIGDAIEVVDLVTGGATAIALAGPANKQGRIVADNIAGDKKEYKGSQGTSILKVFDYDVASTGLNEKMLKAKEIPYLKTYVHGFSHASYYPMAMPIMLKLLFAPKSGKILGAQAIGMESVDKPIDVIATVLRMGGTIENLVEAELAYAPPHGSAKDPVNILGMSAQNILKGEVNPFYFEEIESIDKNSILVDVRTSEERMMGNLDNDTHIPLEELRDRLKELPKNKTIITYCTKGLKSYFASRILSQNGFKVKTLNGGYSIYKELKRSAPKVLKEKKEMAEKIINKTATLKIDACGLSCPGPIMKLSQAMKDVSTGDVVEIETTDAGFKQDINSWAENTGNKVIDVASENKIITAKIQKGSGETKVISSANGKNKSFVVFSNDLDKVMASFIIANGAVAQGDKVTMFFTFWGLNVLRKSEHIKVKKNFLSKMLGIIMPRGADKLKLSKMNFGGAGTKMMKYVMGKNNVPTLTDLIGMAKHNGVRMIACQMAMDVMGIEKEELIDGVEVGGVATYLNEADKSGTNLFI